DGAPDAKMCRIRFAFGGKWGCFGTRGENESAACAIGAGNIPIPTNPVRLRAPKPIPMRLRNWRRERNRSSRRCSQSWQVGSIIMGPSLSIYFQIDVAVDVLV